MVAVITQPQRHAVVRHAPMPVVWQDQYQQDAQQPTRVQSVYSKFLYMLV